MTSQERQVQHMVVQHGEALSKISEKATVSISSEAKVQQYSERNVLQKEMPDVPHCETAALVKNSIKCSIPKCSCPYKKSNCKA
jgi:hypothetical protein